MSYGVEWKRTFGVTHTRVAAICAARLIPEANSCAVLFREPLFFLTICFMDENQEFKSLIGTDYQRLFHFSRSDEEMTCSWFLLWSLFAMKGKNHTSGCACVCVCIV